MFTTTPYFTVLHRQACEQVPRRGPAPVLTPEEEDLINWLKSMARRGLSLRKLQVCLHFHC